MINIMWLQNFQWVLGPFLAFFNGFIFRRHRLLLLWLQCGYSCCGCSVVAAAVAAVWLQLLWLQLLWLQCGCSCCGCSVVAAAVAATVQDMMKFCAEASILRDGQKKHEAVMTIFCHLEGFQSQTYVDQTSNVDPLVLPKIVLLIQNNIR